MILLALAIASPVASLLNKRAAFQDCMEAYAQSFFLARKSPAGIAADALRSCASERQKLRAELARKRPQTGIPDLSEVSSSDLNAAEDRAAVVRVISILNRFR